MILKQEDLEKLIRKLIEIRSIDVDKAETQKALTELEDIKNSKINKVVYVNPGSLENEFSLAYNLATKLIDTLFPKDQNAIKKFEGICMVVGLLLTFERSFDINADENSHRKELKKLCDDFHEWIISKRNIIQEQIDKANYIITTPFELRNLGALLYEQAFKFLKEAEEYEDTNEEQVGLHSTVEYLLNSSFLTGLFVILMEFAERGLDKGKQVLIKKIFEDMFCAVGY